MTKPREAVQFRVVIPARLGSTRLPGKVLRQLAGKPMVQHVWERAVASGATEVLIATDDVQVASVSAQFGALVAMTATSHQSGTDRICEVATARGWTDDELVINVQGDEPCMPSALIRQVAQALHDHRAADISTLCFAIQEYVEWQNPHLVKVVRDHADMALYFSRAAIPFARAHALAGRNELPSGGAFGHLGLYGYRVGALKRFSALPPSTLEEAESLEQLRALSGGLRIHVGLAATRPGAGVDTEADLHRAEQQLMSEFA